MSPEAEELSHGHLYHAPEPTNPANGEVEDTEVGFPGPEHHIAERAPGMKIAMGGLAVLAIIGGFRADPGRDARCSSSFLEPTFADSELFDEIHPTVAAEWIGLAVGAVIGTAGHLHRLEDLRPGRQRRRLSRPASAASTRSSSTSGTSTR